MTTATTHEIILKLLPLTAPISVGISEKADQDSWLNNDNTSLIDSLYQSSSPSGSSSHNRTHQCEQLNITAIPEGYQLETPQGSVSLQEGDIIALKTIQFLVSLQTQVIATPEEIVALPRRRVLPEEDDIWSTQTTKTHQAHVVDPFAYQRPAPTNAPTMPINQVPLPNIPLQAQHTISDLNDPLGFLYPSAPYQSPPAYYATPHPALMSQPEVMPQSSNHYAQPSMQANVLHDLGINEQQAVITRREYTSGKATYLDQSPMDMLDEYLKVDDISVPPANPHYSQPTPRAVPAPSAVPSYYAPTIHDEEEPAGMLGPMKRIFSRKKTDTIQ